MDISVRLSSGLGQFVGSTRLTISLKENATVMDLMENLRSSYPQMDERLDTALTVISGRHVSPAEPLSSGQEVALLLPISGGAK
jgi:molybdopterin converting factor small subunit